MKNIIYVLLITIFTGCVSSKNNLEQQISLTTINGIGNKEIFENKDNWQPINKDITLQNIKNKEVK